MLIFFSFLITIVINIAIGASVLLQAPRRINNIKFALLSASIIGWIATLFFYYSSTNLSAAYFFGRLNYFFAALMPASFFEFIITFPKRIITIPKWIEASVVVHAVFLAVLSFTPFIFYKEAIIHGRHINTYGFLYGFYLISLILVVILSSVILIKKFIKAPYNSIKLQLKYFLFGFCSMALIVILTNGIFPYFLKITFFDPFGPLATIVFLSFVAYAMARHHFMEINRFTAGVAVYTTSILGLSIMYFFVVYLVGKIFFSQVADIRYIIFAVLACVILKYAISPFRTFFWRATNSFFYGHIYTREELFNSISQATTSSIYLKEIIENTLKAIRINCMVHYAAFVVYEDKGEMDLKIITSPNKLQFTLSAQDKEQLKKIPDVCYVDELPNNSLQKYLKKKNVQIIMPINFNTESFGTIFLGEKLSGATYNQYDCTTFSQIAKPIQIAFQNATRVEKIKHFNSRLKKEVKNATKELTRVNSQLRMIDKRKDEFISIASHELKTPTTAIQGFLWLILQKDHALSSYSRDKLERVAKLTGQMGSLIHDMLDVSQIEGNLIRLHPEIFDISQIIAEVKGEQDVLALQKSMHIYIGNKEKLKVKADKERAKQVISNLVNNALKYTPQGGRVRITYKKVDSKVEVSVRDNGVGIKKEDMPRLFTKFGKLKDGHSSGAFLPGTGLGLYITKSFVELSHGTIQVKSSYGKGATFTFTLPAGEMI